MIFLYGLEDVIIAVVLVVGITQVLIPLFKGTPVFPILRSKEPDLTSQLAAERQALEEAKIKQAIKAVHKEVEKLENEGEKENS